ncbi:carboxypeptidase family protein [Neolewinella xylanilytica]|uniref:Carboxypeptidase family protein n=1 Tax=Neolewinella xylanilytica TaxID=1514080 RepID=A0A2S6I0I2_9BACT|nr:TonB-dependent receptor [Neolewinella xylanilytica]PPK84366.1 carboxypeptidase family protein [Neolewinella xylanilytica]
MMRIYLPVLLSILFGNLLSAQATTAALGGQIADTDGVGLPGATVLAIHEPTGTRYGTTAQDDGYYNLNNLRVGGPYTVTVSYIGFGEEVLSDLQLKLGLKRQLDFTLATDGETLDEIVVSAGQNSVINSDRTGAATQISTEVLQRLPTISRSASDFTRLAPSADGNSFGGRNDQYNNFTLDGSIFNNPFGLDAATAGGQSNAQPISLDAIEQIQVNLAPYDVTQAGFTGAAINAVTKSGSNDFQGTVFGFFRNQDLTGSRVAGEDIFVPDLRQVQTGASLGGPIIRDKLFFFANFELERREDLGSNFLAARSGRSGDQVSRVLASDLDAISTALQDRFGYTTGPYERYLHDTKNDKGLFKLDWNIAPGNTLTATYNFLNASRDNNAHPSALGRRGPDATTLQYYSSGYRINNEIQSGIVEWRSLFAEQFSNKLQVGYTSYTDFREPFGSPFPSLSIQRDGTNYIIVGHEPFSINNRLDQRVFQVTNNLQYFAGQHTLTAGVSLERFDFDNSFNLGYYPGIFGPVDADAQSSPQAFIDAVNAGTFDETVASTRAAFERGNASGEGYRGTNFALAETNVGQLGLYLQDEINLNPDFTVTVGIRLDKPLYFNTAEKIEENIARKGGTVAEGGTYAPDVTYYNEQNEPVQFNHTNLPDQSFLFSPRVGFNWDVHGDQSFQLRGGSGLFSGRFPFVWIGNQVANPDFFFYNMTAPDFRFPQVWRSNLGADLGVGNGWTVSTDLIYTADQQAMIVRNYGLRTPSGTLAGVDSRSIYLPEDRAQGPFGGATNAYVFTNTDLGHSFNGSIEIKRSFTNGLYTSLAYSFLSARETSSIEAEISSDAYERNPALGNVNRAVLSPSLYGNRHRVVGSANKQFTYGANDRWATTLALFFQYAEGGRFSYTYSGDINNDGSGLNDLIYIPTSDELDQMSFAGGDDQRRAFGAYIEQDAYLNERRGQYAERYAILSPWYSNWDVRIAQDFKFTNSNRIQLTLDVLNIGNLFNSNWGVRQFPTTTQPIGITGVNADGSPIYSFDPGLQSTFTNDFSLLSRWQMQLGLRFSF